MIDIPISPGSIRGSRWFQWRKIVKIFSAFLLLNLLAASVWAQTRGVVVCQDPSGVPAWEKPESILEVKQLSCGQTVSILSADHGYLKIKIQENLIGYAEARYIRIEGNRNASSQAIDPVPDKQTYEKPQTPAPPRAPASVKPSPPQNLPTREGKKTLQSGLRLVFETSYIRYKEPTISMEDQGAMSGISGDYTFRPNKFMLKLDGRFSFGGVNYSSPGSGTLNNIRDYLIETRFSFGRDFKVSRTAYLTPFTGFGYRFLFDSMGGKVSSLGDYGYHRRSNYLYTPMGLEGMVRLGSNWKLGAAGEYDFFWRGWQYSALYGGLKTIRNTQKSGRGVKASLTIIRNLGRTDLEMEPFFRYWSIENSDIVRGIFEPANRSTELGARLGVRF